MISDVCEDNDAVVMKVGVCEGKQTKPQSMWNIVCST